MVGTDLSRIEAFLLCPTPREWIDFASQPEQEAVLLADHANCEKKAAATALALMHRYSGCVSLLQKMSRLAREELRHFEQVLKVIADRGLSYETVSASRYAQGLHANIRRTEPGRLVDTLVVGALIEARSCERFAKLAPRLDAQLAEFYGSLLKSEARHFEDYLRLAEQYSNGTEVDARLNYFRDVEGALIESPDTDFRFHSGTPSLVA